MRQKFIEKLKNTSIVKDYIDGASTMELGNKYNVSPETVRKFLLLNNVKLRAPKRRQSLRETPPVGKSFGQ